MNPSQRASGPDDEVLVQSSPDRCAPTQKVVDDDDEVLEEDEVRALVRSNAMVGHKRPRGFIDAADLSDMEDGMNMEVESIEEDEDEGDFDPPAWVKEFDPMRYADSFANVTLADKVNQLKKAQVYLAGQLKLQNKKNQ